MFERYSEKARRVIFFARYEASAYGSPYIETEHLLLGLLREDRALAVRLLHPDSIESIRAQIDQHTLKRQQIPTTVDLPLSNECKRVLAYAAEEAELLGSKYILTEHLLLGLLREENSFAQVMLDERGLQLSAIRKAIRNLGDRRAQESERMRLSALILESERMAVHAANDRDAEELESYYCDDAILILANQPPRTGKESIREWIGRLVANRSVRFSYKSVRAEVADDGTLGYTTSEYELEILRQDESIFRESGRWVQVWRRESDQWRIAVEFASPPNAS